MTDDDLIIIENDYDASLNSREEIDQVGSMVDETLKRASDEKSIEPALAGLVLLRKIAQSSVLGMGRFIYGIYQNWEDYEDVAGEDFFDFMYERTGLTRTTINRHIDIQEMLQEVPEKYKNQVEQLKFNYLRPMSALPKAGYLIADQDWKRFVQAGDAAEVRTLCRQIKGKPRRSSMLSIWINKDGTLQCLLQEEEKLKVIGYLDINNQDETVQKAVQRIIKNTGMLERQ